MLRDEGDLGVDEVGQDRVAHRKSIRGLGFVQRWILEPHKGTNILQRTGERYCWVLLGSVMCGSHNTNGRITLLFVCTRNGRRFCGRVSDKKIDLARERVL